MRIVVAGTGYVGLVTGACLARVGHDVACADIDADRIQALNRGEPPFYEPRLGELVERGRADGRLRFTTDLAAAAAGAEVVLVAVGTPPGEDGAADLSAVLAVARTVAAAATGPLVLALKSTVPVGTGDRVQALVDGLSAHPVTVASNPEFLKQGAAVDDFMSPDRVVVGLAPGPGEAAARETFAALYGAFMRLTDRLLFMDRRSAEVAKYAANGLLATKVSYMNEIARLCEAVGADVTAVRQAVGRDARIGSKYLFPGVGFGGSCFPKDIAALRHTARLHGEELAILGAVEHVNARQKALLAEKVLRRFGAADPAGGPRRVLAGRRFAVWGLAFKPGTDDLREAPSVVIIEALLAAGAAVHAHDPEAMDKARARFGDRIAYAADPYAACAGADALLVVTEWNEYRAPDLRRVRDLLRPPGVVYDGRNVYDPALMARLGFEHHPIGRPPNIPPGA